MVAPDMLQGVEPKGTKKPPNEPVTNTAVFLIQKVLTCLILS